MLSRRLRKLNMPLLPYKCEGSWERWSSIGVENPSIKICFLAPRAYIDSFQWNAIGVANSVTIIAVLLCVCTMTYFWSLSNNLPYPDSKTSLPMANYAMLTLEVFISKRKSSCLYHCPCMLLLCKCRVTSFSLKASSFSSMASWLSLCCSCYSDSWPSNCSSSCEFISIQFLSWLVISDQMSTDDRGRN